MFPHKAKSESRYPHKPTSSVQYSPIQDMLQTWKVSIAIPSSWLIWHIAKVYMMSALRKRAGDECADDKHDTQPQQPQQNSDHYSVISIVLASLTLLVLTVYTTIDIFLPCPIEPQAHTFDTPPAFEGPLEPNNRISTIQKHLTGKLRGAESMAIYKGKIYSGVADGRIVEIDMETMTMRTVVEHLGKPPCGPISNERNCGRPLGIRARQGFLYVVDAYLGLFKVNITTGEPHQLFAASMKFPDGHEPRFLNDVELGKDGLIYVTDSSYKWGRENHPYVGFENRPDGRLIAFDPVTKQVRILARDLYFANGLQLSEDEAFILITEMSRCRVTKLYLRGPRTGEMEVFADNLPGLPDNIRPNTRGGYWVALSVVRHPDKWSVWDSTAPYPWLKRIMARFLHKFTIGRMVPRYGLVVELDKDGHIISSLHDVTGSTMPAVSEVREQDGVLYFGSYYLPFIGTLRKNV